MNIDFDYWNRVEDPTLFLCNPNNDRLALIPMYDNLVIKPTFNGLSEISLNIYKYIKDKDTGIIDLDRECDCYKYIDVYRQIHVKNLGYFIICSCEENNDGINPYINVTANSCEIELNNARLNIADGTYQFYDSSTPSNTILGKILNLCPAWKAGTISSAVASRYRTFTDLNQNVYAFMSGDMSNAFECIADFDIETRTINILDANTEIVDTDILLTFDNVLKNVKVSKSSDNIVTALSVSGSDGLEIRNANPLGTNVIYNFSYYKNTNWMTQGLIDAVNAWEKKISDSQSSYDSLISQIITENVELSNLDGQLSDLTTALKSLKQIESVATTSDYPTAHAAVVAKQAEVDKKQTEVNNKQTQIDTLSSQLSTLQSSLSITNNFTVSQYIELSQYIHQSSYRDENITVTDSMTYGQKQDQIKLLYNKGIQILAERAQPTLTITFDCNNFLFIKEFEIFRNQFNLGKKIHVELEPEKIVSMAVLQYELDFESKDLKITVSNRLKLHDQYTKVKDLNAQVSASASTITFGKDNWNYPVKSGILDNLDIFSKSALNLTNNPLITADGQHAVFDDTGYHGFRIDPSTGTYSPKQMEITNNVIRFTTDNWNTIKAAFGEFTLSNGTVVYGLNADTIVAGTIDATTINVTNINATNITTGEFNADLIKTGRIESVNGDYSLDMETGEVNMKRGNFAGSVSWDSGSYIKKDGDSLLINNGQTMQITSINSDINSIADNGKIAMRAQVIGFQAPQVGFVGDFYANGEKGLTTQVGITTSSGTHRTLQFTNGILTDNDV